MLEQIAQTGLGVSVLGDIQNLTEYNSEILPLPGPTLSTGLGQTTSTSTILQFCDSESTLETKAFLGSFTCPQMIVRKDGPKGSSHSTKRALEIYS